MRGSRAIASNRSPSSLRLRRGLDVNRCHSGRGGSGSAGRSFSRTKMTKAGGAPIERRMLEISHHRYRKGKRIMPPVGYPPPPGGSPPPPRGGGGGGGGAHFPSRPRSSDYLRHLEVLVHLFAQARRAVLLPHMLVVRHAGEQVVAARGKVGAGCPILGLQRHVALLS